MDVDFNHAESLGLDKKLFQTDLQAVLNDPDVDIAIELIGGTTTARDITKKFLKAGKNRRQAVLVCTDSFGEWKGLSLSEEPQLRLPAQAVFSGSGMHLLPIQADSQAALLDRLDKLSTQVALGESLPELAGQTLADFTNAESQTYTLGLVGSSTDELLSEIEHAQRGIERAFETGKDWQSPAGSAFSETPGRVHRVFNYGTEPVVINFAGLFPPCYANYNSTIFVDGPRCEGNSGRSHLEVIPPCE